MHAERVRPSRNGVTGNHGSSPLSGISLAVPCPVITTPTKAVFRWSVVEHCQAGDPARGHGQPRGCCRRRSERTLVRVGPRLPRFPRAGTDPRPAALRSHALTTSRRKRSTSSGREADHDELAGGAARSRAMSARSRGTARSAVWRRCRGSRALTSGRTRSSWMMSPARAIVAEVTRSLR